MRSSGSYLMAGLRDGINGNAGGAINAAYNVGVRVVQALNSATGVQSPSREAMKTGRFFDMGLMIGVTKYASVALLAAKNLGEDMVDEINPIVESLDFLNGFEPVITPQIDTSYVDKGIARLESGFDGLGTLPINMQGRYMASAFKAMTTRKLMDEDIQNGIQKSQIVNNYDLTQNNYSPKALSRIDIYRDTRNQFTRLKEVVNA